MKNYFLFIYITFFCFAAFSCRDKYDVNTYFETQKRDSLLTDIITYIYARPQYAEWNTRFDSRFRQHYVSQLDKFRFEMYHEADNGLHFFYIVRPAKSALGNTRGVGGKFRLNEIGEITSFEEIFNTPVASLPELQRRGKELFLRMINDGDLSDYLKHPDYIEWPNDMTYYDTVRHEWLIRPGL